MSFIDFFDIAVLALTFWFLLVTVVNAFYLKLQSKKPSLRKGPRITVMVPARNEEEHIRLCLEHLLNQDYEDYEILVMNDNSTDKTGEILEEMAAAHPRIRVYNGAPLEKGWFGKPYALQQLSRHATGEYFLFSDADTVHSRTSLSFCMTNALHHRADLVSAYPRELITSIGEVMNVSAMFFMTAIVMPLPVIDLFKWKKASFCLGQYFFIRAEVFRGMDGFEPVRHEITEDVAFGNAVKERGFRTKFLDAQSHVACHMYKDYPEAFRGIGKNVYNAVGHNGFLLLGIAFLIIGCIDYPVIRLFAGLLSGGLPLTVFWTVLLFSAMWLINVIDRKMPLYSVLLYPFQFFNVLLMALYYAWQFKFGKGIIWKNRKMH